MNLSGNNRSGKYEKIITHHDFDGIVSASICGWVLKIQKVMFAGPLTITRSQITITDKDVVCDLPYPLQCGLWFDHHEGNLQELSYRRIDPKSIPGRFDLRSSCGRVVYEYFCERTTLPSHFLEAVEEADMIDSFAYTSIEDWRKETPGKIIDLTLKLPFPSQEEQTQYMRNLFQQIRDRPLKEVSSLDFVRKRLGQYQAAEQRMLRIIREASYFLEEDGKKELVIIDLTSYQRRPTLIKNLAFLIYPQSLAVLEVYNLIDYQGVKSNHLGLTMSLSIHGNRSEGGKNIGEIMRTLNIGDGHPGAAAGQIRCRSKQEMLKRKREVLAKIFKLWQAQSSGSLLKRETSSQGSQGSVP